MFEKSQQPQHRLQSTRDNQFSIYIKKQQRSLPHFLTHSSNNASTRKSALSAGRSCLHQRNNNKFIGINNVKWLHIYSTHRWQLLTRPNYLLDRILPSSSLAWRVEVESGELC
eukprot:scaffold38698_cov73-Cyclotella_meneghiniana.AAC.4